MSSLKVLHRKVGEGSFAGFKRLRTREDLIEWLRHPHAYRYAGSELQGLWIYP